MGAVDGDDYWYNFVEVMYREMVVAVVTGGIAVHSAVVPEAWWGLVRFCAPHSLGLRLRLAVADAPKPQNKRTGKGRSFDDIIHVKLTIMGSLVKRYITIIVSGSH